MEYGLQGKLVPVWYVHTLLGRVISFSPPHLMLDVKYVTLLSVRFEVKILFTLGMLS